MNTQVLNIKNEITSSRKNRENYKSLKANIDFAADDVQVIMVTSSIPGEGKSTVALHLAVEFAESGKNVLLLDCDLRKSRYADDFHIARGNRIGVADMIKEKKFLEKAIFSTDLENLNVVLAGTVPKNPSEMLQTVTFQGLLEVLRKKYDYIIMDIAPIASVIDAAVVAKRVDGVVYVIGSDEISCRVARRGLQQLERAGARILGTVLNKIKYSNRALYGTYGANKYYYGSYSDYYEGKE